MKYLLLIVLGLLLGVLLNGIPVVAQNAEAIFGSDSSTSLPSVIQTNGSNALKVISK